MNAKAVSFFITLLLHVFLFTFLLYIPKVDSKKDDKRSNVPVNIISQTKPHIADQAHALFAKHDTNNSGGGEKCKEPTFTGIGVLARPGSGLILDIAENSPASKAGVKINDRILNLENIIPNDYKAGQAIILEVMRDTAHFTLKAYIDNVCKDLAT